MGLTMPILAEGSLNLLAVNPGLLIWTTITFITVLVVLYFTAWKTIIKAIDERNDRIEADIEKGKEVREKAEALLREYEQKLNAAKEEAHHILDESRKDAISQRDKILEDARIEAEKISKRVEAEIEQAKVKALDELEHTAVDMAAKVIEAVFKNAVTADNHRAIAERELKNIKN